MAKLTGLRLVAKVEELGDLSKNEIALACGYESILEFFEAFLSAKSGIELDASVSEGHVKTDFDFSKFDLLDEALVKCTKVSRDLSELHLSEF